MFVPNGSLAKHICVIMQVSKICLAPPAALHKYMWYALRGHFFYSPPDFCLLQRDPASYPLTFVCLISISFLCITLLSISPSEVIPTSAAVVVETAGFVLEGREEGARSAQQNCGAADIKRVF